MGLNLLWLSVGLKFTWFFMSPGGKRRSLWQKPPWRRPGCSMRSVAATWSWTRPGRLKITERSPSSAQKKKGTLSGSWMPVFWWHRHKVWGQRRRLGHAQAGSPEGWAYHPSVLLPRFILILSGDQPPFWPAHGRCLLWAKLSQGLGSPESGPCPWGTQLQTSTAPCRCQNNATSSCLGTLYPSILAFNYSASQWCRHSCSHFIDGETEALNVSADCPRSHKRTFRSDWRVLKLGHGDHCTTLYIKIIELYT